PSKPAKEKGTRSVSTLTPSQLARKRANNREAQRAVRARTKEHIERLEREVEELKCKQNRDETLQELIRKNKYLKKEIARLRETYGIPALTSHPYAPSIYDDPAVSSRTSSSFGQHSPDYHQVGEYGASYIMATPEPSEPWTPVLPCSTGLSPASSGSTEEYGYIPTNVPARIEGLPPTLRIDACMKYEKLDNDNAYSRGNGVPTQPTYIHQQQWHIPYSGTVYYPQSPALRQGDSGSFPPIRIESKNLGVWRW
ncbi:hypothetical protein ACKVWM_011652, partial [Pyricularia oryzae]